MTVDDAITHDEEADEGVYGEQPVRHGIQQRTCERGGEYQATWLAANSIHRRAAMRRLRRV